MAERGVWVKIDDVCEPIREENWSLYWQENKSESEEFERLLREPLEVLKEEVDEIEDDWHVITQIVNHHIPIKKSPICLVGMVMPEDKIALLIFYKHRPEG
jgi:hypothetical protein